MPKRVSMAALRAAWLDPRLTTAQIAAQFGIGREAVRRRAAMMGLPQRRRGVNPHLDHDHLLRMHRLGMSHAAIAEVLGCHWMTVFNTLRRLGEPGRPPGQRSGLTAAEYLAQVEAGHDPVAYVMNRDQRNRLVARMWRAGVSRRDIGRVVGLSVWTVTKVARRAGEPPRDPGGFRHTTLAEFRQMLIEDRLAAGMRRVG